MKKVNDYQQELLKILLQEEGLYPWNPADPEAEEYFAQQQENCSFIDTLNSDEMLKIDNSLYFNGNNL